MNKQDTKYFAQAEKWLYAELERAQAQQDKKGVTSILFLLRQLRKIAIKTVAKNLKLKTI